MYHIMHKCDILNSVFVCVSDSLQTLYIGIAPLAYENDS